MKKTHQALEFKGENIQRQICTIVLNDSSSIHAIYHVCDGLPITGVVRDVYFITTIKNGVLHSDGSKLSSSLIYGQNTYSDWHINGIKINEFDGCAELSEA